jgi:hypothetical protein
LSDLSADDNPGSEIDDWDDGIGDPSADIVKVDIHTSTSELQEMSREEGGVMIEVTIVDCTIEVQSVAEVSTLLSGSSDAINFTTRKFPKLRNEGPYRTSSTRDY